MAQESDAFLRAEQLLRDKCVECHSGADPDGGLSLAEVEDESTIANARSVWEKVRSRVFAGEMPPADAEPLKLEDRQWLSNYIPDVFRRVACGGGPQPGPYRLRRLNRHQFSNSVRDLLNAHFDIGATLPVDGAGGEGFDNAAETLFLSPIHGEKYLEASRDAFAYVAKNEASRKLLLPHRPSGEVSEEQAARSNLQEFMRRAYRRPVEETEIDALLSLFGEARRTQGLPWDEALFQTMQVCLVSPKFLYLVEQPAEPRQLNPLSAHELATRLSYFLWDTLPDDKLRAVADDGTLLQPDVLDAQVLRMIEDPKHLIMLESFVGQWLGTRDFGRGHKLDAGLFPEANDELVQVLRMEPVLMVQRIVKENRSLEELIDADYTFINDRTVRLYKVPREGLKLNQNLKLVELPEGHDRGGLLTTAAVLAISSYPTRTSPVLRGKWILEKLLNAPPPPPPPNVPALSDNAEEVAGKTLRARLEIHRSQAACAACHDNLDPLGFGLEGYDALGRKRAEENGQPIDTSGKLPSGETFSGAEELKQLLHKRKDQVIRNFVIKLFSYAVGRSLVDRDYCEIDRIFDRVKQDGYHGQTLILEIVRGDVFRNRSWRED